ncbi:transcriptional regulator NanR [Marinivivus vitaminiproducens]|uniref:transcriptional regulator NanR n=1 Tax=Marinivivus vitaminiproducens TaxID=3035935 RepID=UPI0027A326A9|nr:transcriptional regulator NanR [Geminicoccaceae bacterium SCSIO 64248]
MAATGPIQRRKLYQEVLDRLLQRIEEGEFGPGDHLPSERALMEAYHVGRPAVREALQTLARSGIVTISHGERARVSMPTAATVIEQVAESARHLLQTQPQTLEHLKEARLLFEKVMVRRAAERATPAGVARLEAHLAVHRQARTEDFLAKDMLFHREIAAMSGNPIFPALVEAMFEWLAAFYVKLVRLPGTEQLTIAEHERILAAIAAHDPDAAERAMDDHLSRANQLYRQFE